MSKIKCCDDCDRFLEVEKIGEEGFSEGICQRFPPVLVYADTHLYPDGWEQPMVRGNCRCGEFLEKAAGI